jgi:hypothetical protein
VNVSQLGMVRVSVSVGAGKPVAVTVNVFAVPTENVLELPLVSAGACLTVRVKFWTAFDPTPLLAVKVMG